MDNFSIIPVVTLVFVVSFCLSVVIWSTRNFQMSYINRRGDLGAVQSSHSVPTPRLGGVAIVAALSLGSFLIPGDFGDATSLLLLCLAPLLSAGLWEDIGKGVSPRGRMALAALSSLLVVAAFGIWVERVGVPAADWALGFAPVGIAFTIFAVVGVTNAFNLIDGINGLCSGCAMMALLLIGFYSGLIYDSMLILLIGSMMGFLLFNLTIFGRRSVDLFNQVKNTLVVIVIYRLVIKIFI
mgnify:CR=1 FL=1